METTQGKVEHTSKLSFILRFLKNCKLIWGKNLVNQIELKIENIG